MIFYLYDNDRNEIQRKSVDSNYTMSNLMLSPATNYVVSLYGYKKGETYTIKFLDIKDHNSSNEAEPNDKKENSYGINVEEPINGFFTGDEWDCYHFYSNHLLLPKDHLVFGSIPRF